MGAITAWYWIRYVCFCVCFCMQILIVLFIAYRNMTWLISLACVSSETHNLQAVFFFVFSTQNDCCVVPAETVKTGNKNRCVCVSVCGGTPLYKLVRYVPTQRALFWSEDRYRLWPCGLESGQAFEGFTGVYECICHFNSNWIRKKAVIWEIQNGFWDIFWLACQNIRFYVPSGEDRGETDANPSNNEIIFAYARSKNWYGFRRQVWKRVFKRHFLVLNRVSIWRTGRHIPPRIRRGTPLSPGVTALCMKR